MSKALSVNINHTLGAADARRRIESGISQFRSSLGSKLSLFEETWIDNHLDFKVGFMGQICSGTLDVYETKVCLDVQLPGMLGVFARKVQSLATRKGQLLLGR
jgi:hypothetical protein